MKPLTLTPATAGGAAALPRGFSLIELLIAATIGLVVMGAVASLFGIFGRSASETQSIVDMTNRLRGTALRDIARKSGVAESVIRECIDAADAAAAEPAAKLAGKTQAAGAERSAPAAADAPRHAGGPPLLSAASSG
jgi:prepilin-type N-terminal cleavage/methylation domain-containing protein